MSRYVDERIKGTRDPAQAAAHLRALLAGRSFDWVIVADETLLLALLEQKPRGSGWNWLPFGPLDDDAAALLLSKYAFTQQAPALGIPTPESYLAATPDACATAARTLGYPVVLKGEHGFAGLQVSIVHDEGTLRSASAGIIAKYGRALVQRFVKGRPVSAAVLYAHGQPLGYKAYLTECSYPTNQSPSTLHEYFSHPAIDQVVRAIGAATGFHGLAGVDFMYEQDTDTLYALEVNPRPTSAFGGSSANRAFFAPLVAAFLRGESPATRVYDRHDRGLAYFPVHLFYFARRADKRHAQSYRRLLACLRECDPAEWRLALWESARFVYDELARTAPSVRSYIDVARVAKALRRTRNADLGAHVMNREGRSADLSPNLCIAIATYRRPQMLAALLRKLSTLTFQSATPRIEVLVVDNDPDGGARPVVESSLESIPWPVHYRHVATPGLSVVRNYAIDFAAPAFDLLAMIDDDEEPEPGWLDELLRVQRLGADAVIGPVPRTLPADAPAWIRKGNFFPAAAFDVADGHRVRDGHTGNCLLKLPTIKALGLAFDPAMNLTGGEDVLFFRQLIKGGGCIRFAANAVATESVPLARTAARYILTVEFRSGNTLAFCDRMLGGALPSTALRFAKALRLIAVGLVLLPPRLLTRGTAGAVKSACNLARGAGMLTGLFGYRISMYKRASPAPGPAVAPRPFTEAGATVHDKV